MSRPGHIIFQVILTTVAFTMGMIVPVSAHKSSDSYLSLRFAGPEVVGQWDIALRDLDYALNLDTNYDGIVTWGELRAHQAVIADYMLSHLRLRSDGLPSPSHGTSR